ncbi:MAG TPA: hypothetical protein VK213_04530 [Bacteroidales bacterium]|nr:hypothetical protein [Bacteroidales bacterium]
MNTKTKKDKNIQYNAGVKDILKNYSMEIQAAKRSPKQYYTQDGSLRSVK